MEYLNLCQEALRKPDPGLGAFARENDEVIRSAGARLMITPAYGAVGIGESLFGLFQECNVISSLRYEGEDGTGTVLISRKGHPNVEVALALTCPVRTTDYRAVRKLLETSSGDLSLLSDSVCVYGLGRTVGQYDWREEDLFLVRFTKHYAWELYHAESVMMQVTHGQPKLPEESISEQAFEKCGQATLSAPQFVRSRSAMGSFSGGREAETWNHGSDFCRGKRRGPSSK